MMSSLYIGTTGMKVHDSGLGVTANNMANVNTIAFKQQDWLFQDIFYENLAMGQSSDTLTNQLGMGAMLMSTRTLFTQGSYEATGNFTDLSIQGDGFFSVVSEEGDEYLTRSGDFIFDNEGYLIDPTGARLQGYAIDPETGAEAGLGDIKLDIVNDAPLSKFVTTSTMAGQFNFSMTESSVDTYETITVPAPTPTDPDAVKEQQVISNPFFSLLNTYNAEQDPPLPDVPYTQPMTYYDNEGNEQEITLHFDIATNENGQKIVEFIATMPSEMDARNVNPPSKAGLLMSGTMTFSSSGQLTNMSAFTPTAGSDLSDLSNWTPAALNEEGLPILSINSVDTGLQEIALNFGAKAENGWSNPNVTAADISNGSHLLPSLGVPAELEAFAATAYAGSTSSLSNYDQDGLPEGTLVNIQFSADGNIQGQFSNGTSENLYRIPLYRVTSEDGLRREGNNHYTVTDASGLLEEGIAGTENYGTIRGSSIETSNVDMAAEMVDLIILQRGFQTNSKVVTTSDEMLQKALEIKRT